MTSRILCTLLLAFASKAVLASSGQHPAETDEVRLLAAVRLPSGASDIRLGDVAVITGPGAEQLATIKLRPAPESGAAIEISISDVRRAMESASVHWGRTNLTGRSVIVRSRPTATERGPSAMTPVRIGDAPDEPESRATRVGSEELVAGQDPLLRGTIAEVILEMGARELNVPAGALRLAVRQRDHDFMLMRTAGLTPEVRMESAWASERVGLTIVLRDAEGTHVRTERLSIRPEVRTLVPAPQRDVASGERLEDADLSITEAWLSPPHAHRVAAPEEPRGQIAARRLRAGEPILAPQIRGETLVQRGDHVKVRCLVGGIVITMTAEARSAGAEGDVIELRKIGERTTFTAPVTGQREVTLDLRR